MNANQMIMLLQIYRGTLQDELMMGTHDSDLRSLIKLGYVEVNRDRLFTTARATKHIRQHVLQEMP